MTGEMDIYFIYPVLGYLLGSIPFGLLLARLKGVDIRARGSGNIGATNVARIIGKGFGLATLAADILKGLVPVLICKYAMNGQAGQESFMALTGAGAILGHCYSIFLRFKGGKGVATAAGVFLAICPFSVFVAIISFLIAALMSGYVSLGSLLAAFIIPVAVHFICPGLYFEILAWGTAVLVWWKHRENIQRLLKGQEKRLKKTA